MKLTPRYYQLEAHAAVFDYFRKHPVGNPALAMPTGTGKAVQIAMFCQEVLQTWPTQRLMMLTHVKELVEQNAQKLKTLWPQAPLGIYSAGLRLKQATMPITFASVQSAAKNPHLFGRIDIVLVDECHLVGPDDAAVYQKFIAFLKQGNPHLRVIGLSATIYRLGLGMITDNGIFTDVCYDITGRRAFTKLLDEGYLCSLVPIQMKTILDVSGVAKRNGDFITSQLTAATKQDVTIAALDEMLAATVGSRKHTLIFAIDIAHAEDIYRLLKERGIDCGYIHSKGAACTTEGVQQTRDGVLAAFKAGTFPYLINKDILTTGFDFPGLDCLVLLRPTASPVLHVQMLGRGTRPFYAEGADLSSTEGRAAAIAASSKPNCLVLDFAGNTMRLGPINDPTIPRKKGEGAGDVPAKVCQECGCINHISARVCVNCDEPFQFEVKITSKASTADLIVRDEPQVELFTVTGIEYKIHVKPGSPPSLKVAYRCGIRRFEEWICLEHNGRPIQHKAHDWWKARSPWPPPPTVAQAHAYIMENKDALKVPSQIRVWVNQKHPTILAHVFA